MPELVAAVDEQRAAVERKRDELALAQDLLARTAAVVDRNRDMARAREDPFEASDFFADFEPSPLPFQPHEHHEQPQPQPRQPKVHQQHQHHQHPAHDPCADRLAFPFYVVSAKQETKIEMEVSSMRDEVRFTFDAPYEIFDNNEILRRIPVAPLFSLLQGS